MVNFAWKKFEIILFGLSRQDVQLCCRPWKLPIGFHRSRLQQICFSLYFWWSYNPHFSREIGAYHWKISGKLDSSSKSKVYKILLPIVNCKVNIYFLVIRTEKFVGSYENIYQFSGSRTLDNLGNLNSTIPNTVSPNQLNTISHLLPKT